MNIVIPTYVIQMMLGRRERGVVVQLTDKAICTIPTAHIKAEPSIYMGWQMVLVNVVLTFYNTHSLPTQGNNVV